jgi:hypothetical protein
MAGLTGRYNFPATNFITLVALLRISVSLHRETPLLPVPIEELTGRYNLLIPAIFFITLIVPPRLSVLLGEIPIREVPC